METVRNYLRLIRLERALSATFGVLFTGILVGDLIASQSIYVIACLLVFFSAMANFGLNRSIVDRPLAQGQLKPETALFTAIISTVPALILSFLLNPVARLLIFLGLPISLLYNLVLKRYFLLKNVFIGLANVGVVLIDSLVSDVVLEPLALYIAVIGFFFSLSYVTIFQLFNILLHL